MSETLPTAIFAGTGKFAAEILTGLVKLAKVDLVITRPYPPMLPSPVAEVAVKHGLPLSAPPKIQLEKDRLTQLQPDVMIVADYGQIIPLEILQLPRKSSLNVHPSLLPKYRGPAPIQQAILNGDKETGTTLMLMDSQMDHGPIIAQSTRFLTETETAPELEQQLALDSLALLNKYLSRYLNNEIVPQEQLHELATAHSYTNKEDGEINQNMTIATIDKKYRAYQPWPGIWMWQDVRGKLKRLKIVEMSLGSLLPSAQPGHWTWFNDTLLWRAQDAAINIKKLQVEGGKILNAKEFFIGYPGLFEK
jgi:methionyl-tRNA formyltransferase